MSVSFLSSALLFYWIRNSWREGLTILSSSCQNCLSISSSNRCSCRIFRSEFSLNPVLNRSRSIIAWCLLELHWPSDHKSLALQSWVDYTYPVSRTTPSLFLLSLTYSRLVRYTTSRICLILYHQFSTCLNGKFFQNHSSGTNYLLHSCSVFRSRTGLWTRISYLEHSWLICSEGDCRTAIIEWYLSLSGNWAARFRQELNRRLYHSPSRGRQRSN
jgi:hypothetical protein